MMFRNTRFFLCFSSIVLTNLLACATNSVTASPRPSWTEQERAIISSLWLGNYSPPVDTTNRFIKNPRAIELGHRLFFDTRLSASGNISCASCHQPEKYFTDGLKTARGIETGQRNTPTIVGSSGQTWFFHDGRADSLWSQALAPLEDDKEHGSSRLEIVKLIYHDPQLRKRYEEFAGSLVDIPAFDNGHSIIEPHEQKIVDEIFVTIGKAIAAYESQLQPGPSRFDRYAQAIINNNISSMHKSLTPLEENGLRIFVREARCITCHSGPLFSDQGFHNISVQPEDGHPHDWGRYKGARKLLENPFNCRSQYNDSHSGELASPCDELKHMVMSRHETQGAMKTPSLRNISKTAPYMHAGQYASLRDVIEHYNTPPPARFRRSELFLQVDLTETEMDMLEAFLKSLDSDIISDRKYLKSPRHSDG